MSRAVLEASHPRLKRAPYGITSPVDPAYNCIGYAAGDSERWWWPFQGLGQAYWPAGVPRELTLKAFVDAYATIGYTPCEDGGIEAGYEKIAILADPQGRPAHAAKQLPSGRWSSKMGPQEDISHLLYQVQGPPYGDVAQYLRRKIAPKFVP